MNFIDYLNNQGQTFEQRPFCEVDALVLSYLAYVKLDGIAPQYGREAKTVEEISREFFEKYSEEDLKKDRSFIRLAPQVMEQMAKTGRFRKAQVRNYVNMVDTGEELQFSAMEVLLEDGSSFVAFRGTDDNIVGWKEDFLLSNGVIQAELEAAAYLKRAARETDRPLRVGGHSKGGNLAIYAAADSEKEIRERILEVYNLDGPGFAGEFLEKASFEDIRPRMKRYIPEASIIGMLLEHVAEPVIVASSQRGIMQHDGFSWQVEEDGFVRKEKLDKTAVVFNDTLRLWLSELSEEQKTSFIEDFFAVLEAPGALTLTELYNGGFKSAGRMIRRMETLKPETKQLAEELLRSLMEGWRDSFGLLNAVKEKLKNAEEDT